MAILRENANRLLTRMTTSTLWPRKEDLVMLNNLYKWSWFREADSTRLKGAHPNWDDEKAYLVDPLASRIAEAFADLIFGEEPDFLAGKKEDQDRLEDIIRANNLPSELQNAAELSTSEGEVWWRCRVEKDALDWPMVEFHSRTSVVPLFKGRHVVAAAFVTVFEDDNTAWRYVEVHAEGILMNKLFRVPETQSEKEFPIGYNLGIIPMTMQPGRAFGEEVSLSERVETKDLPAVWEHGLPMLAGRIINRRGRTPKIGISQFARAEDFLFSLNEAATIGMTNMRLTARKRVVVDESVLQPKMGPDGEQLNLGRDLFRADEEVFVAGGLDENMDSNTTQFKVLEYDFDAQAMVTWTDHLVDTILTRTRTAPQLVGRHTESAITGPALRARLLDSILASHAKARYYDDGVPQMLKCLQLLDKHPVSDRGFGRSWADPNEKPAMKRKSIVPEDPKDKIDRHAIAMGAEVESQYTAIADLHPDWDDTKIKEEQDRIREDRNEKIEAEQDAAEARSDQGGRRTGTEGTNFNNDRNDPNKRDTPHAEIS